MKSCEIGYDVIVVGGGPAGVQAAISSVTEGFSTLLIEPGQIGGQFHGSPRLENLAGYTYGVPGRELASSFENQLFRLGVVVIREKAVSLHRCHASDGLGVTTETRSHIGKAVVIATGQRFADMEVEGTELDCVHYGPQTAMSLGPEAEGKKIVVIGGGNSAGQTIEYLGVRAGEVHVLTGRRGLVTSAYLTEQITAMPRVTVHHSRAVRIHSQGGGRCSVHTDEIAIDLVDYVFICAGMIANTDWLEGSGVSLLSDGRVAQSMTYGQFATNIPGVFAIGDVRQDGGGRVPIALGEGASVNRALWDYLR